MFGDIPNPEDEMDPREREDMRVDEDDRSIDSEEADKRQKLGEITDEDLTDEEIGTMKEITHDAKVTKEILKVGEGKRMRMGFKAIIKYKAYFFKDHLIFDSSPGDGEGATIELNLGSDD